MDVLIEKTAAELRMQLLDTTKRPYGIDVTTLLLTLYNDSDATVLNARDGTNVFNTNGGTYTPTVTITGATKTNPVVVTSVAHSLLSGDLIFISGVAGMTEINGRVFEVQRLSDDTFSLYDRGAPVNGLKLTEYTSGGTGKIGLFKFALTTLDNALSGTVTNGQRQRHVAQILANSTARIEHVFEVEQRPRPT